MKWRQIKAKLLRRTFELNLGGGEGVSQEDQEGAMQVKEENTPQSWQAEAGLVGLRATQERTPPCWSEVVEENKGT